MASVYATGRVWLPALLAYGLGAGNLAAQVPSGAVTGHLLKEGTDAPVPNADVVLKGSSDSVTVARTRSLFDGQFRLTLPGEGTYFLRVSSLGYSTRTTEPFEVKAGTVYDFGGVELSVDVVVLAPIHVLSAREAVSYEAGRTSYLISGLPSAHGGAVADALRALPELDVDFDGNVELRGESPAIWVNDRPAPISGQALRQFLDQFPAELVDRIEVIDNPSAEFDAEGTGGIVNIVLEEGADLGLSGSVFANVDTGRSTGLGGRGTLQRGDWVWNGSLSFRHRDSETEGFNLRQDRRTEPSRLIQRDTWTNSGSLGADVSLGTTYTPGQAARLWVAGDYSGQDRERSGLVTTKHMYEAKDPFLRYDRTNRAGGNGRSMELRTGFEWRWEPRRHFAEVEVRYARRNTHDERREEVDAEVSLDTFDLAPAELTLRDQESDERDVRFDLRYRRPVGEHTSLSAGYSLQDEATANERTMTAFDPIDDPDGRAEVRGVERVQTLHAGFVTLERTVTGRLEVEGGLRTEHVSWRLEFPAADPVRGRHVDIFPSVTLGWNLEPATQLRLSYSRRTARPSPHVFDPTDRSADPLERSVGNPEIEPRYIHRWSLDGKWSAGLGTLSGGPYVSRAVNGWEGITTVDDDGVSTRTWANLSSETSAGLSLSYSFHGVGGWRGAANLTGSWTDRDADTLDPRFSGSYTRWQTGLNVSGPIYGGLTGQASLRYRGATRGIQGRTGSQATVDLSLRRRFMENRLSLNLSLRDPLALRKTEREVRDAGIREVHRSSRSVRSAQLSVSYALGGGGRLGR